MLTRNPQSRFSLGSNLSHLAKSRTICAYCVGSNRTEITGLDEVVLQSFNLECMHVIERMKSEECTTVEKESVQGNGLLLSALPSVNAYPARSGLSSPSHRHPQNHAPQHPGTSQTRAPGASIGYSEPSGRLIIGKSELIL